MNRFSFCVVALMAVALRADAVSGAEQELKKNARAVREKYQHALVTVKLTIKTRAIFEGKEFPNSEHQVEVEGTVLKSNGLTIVSDSATNPSARFLGEEGGVKIETETSDVKLVLKDGKEVPAKFVLRDQDLDLAFIMPEEKMEGLPHVTLEKNPIPDVMEDVIYLYRLSKALNREAAVSVGQVEAVVKKPRTFVVASHIPEGGCPAFDSAGKPFGVIVWRRAPGQKSGPAQTIILTAEDIYDAADQIGKQEKP